MDTENKIEIPKIKYGYFKIAEENLSCFPKPTIMTEEEYLKQKKNKLISVEEFLALIPYKSKWIGEDLEDGVRFITFRDKKNWTTNLEFGTKDCDGKGQYLYWEIIDWTEYNNGEVLSLNSNKRHDVINTYLTQENKQSIAAKISESLKNFYRKS